MRRRASLRRTGCALGTVATLLAACPLPSVAQVPRLIDPREDALTYGAIRALSLREGIPARFIATRPWTTTELSGFLGKVEEHRTDGRRMPLVELLRESVPREVAGPGAHRLAIDAAIEVRAAAGEHDLDPAFLSIRSRENLGEPDGSAGARFGVRYLHRATGLVGGLHLRATTNARDRYDFRDRDPDGAMDVRSGYVLWERDPILLLAGRFPLDWGSGLTGGLGISGGGPSFDGFLARARTSRLQATIVSAWLEDEPANRRRNARGNTIPGSRLVQRDGPDVDRYFHAHRLDVAVGERLALGLQEMALVTGVGRRTDLRYLTGLLPYVAVQNSGDEIDEIDVNLGLGAEYRLRLSKRVELYGEYFANEVFVDSDLVEVIDGLRGKRTNTQGFVQGIRWARAFGIGGFDIEGEWTRAEHFLYLHRGLNTSWERSGVPIGAFWGPDNEVGRVRVVHDRVLADRGLLRTVAGVVVRRRGVGRISDAEDIRSGAALPRPAPRGPVERSVLGTLALEWWWPEVGRATVAVAAGRVEDVDNLPGRDITPVDLELSLALGTRWTDAF